MGIRSQMVLRITRIFNYQMIPNAGDNTIVRAPLIGPIEDVSSVDILEFCLLGDCYMRWCREWGTMAADVDHLGHDA